jgi:threonine synthase
LKEGLKDSETGVFLETAHPAKFKEKVDNILNIDIDIPARLAEFMKGKKQSIEMDNSFTEFKKFLLDQ